MLALDPAAPYPFLPYTILYRENLTTNALLKLLVSVLSPTPPPDSSSFRTLPTPTVAK